MQNLFVKQGKLLNLLQIRKCHNLKGTGQRLLNTKIVFSDFNVFNLEEYEAVWRTEVLYTNKEVNLLSHEVNMEARLMVVQNETAVYR
jgi:hypothetical protein